MRLNGHDQSKHDTAILEQNGYAHLRTAILAAPQAAGAIPLDVYDAAIRYAEGAVARLKLDTDPRAADARRQAEYEVELMRCTRRFRAILGELDDRRTARQALHVRP